MRLLITAGPTREHIDSVRFVSNASSGRMGYALAREAIRRGHEVVLISGPVDLPAPSGAETIRVVSAVEMFKAAVERFPECHACVMAAAVCDYRPIARHDHKLPKQSAGVTVAMEQTADILAHLGTIKEDRVLIGFALEDQVHQAHAEKKLRRKNCDAVVLNDLSVVGDERSEIRILHAVTGWSGPFAGTKDELAVRVIDLAEQIRREKPE